MTRFRIRPSSLDGSVTLPPSKSHTLRALLFGLLAKGKTVVHSPLHSPDTNALLKAITFFGGEVKVDSDKTVIFGVDRALSPAEDVIDVGNSGILLRFLGAVSALSPYFTVLTGDYSIRHQRLAKPLLNGIRQLGGFAESARQDDFAPLLIKGPLQGGYAVIDGEESQPVSALLIASALAKAPTHIHVKNPGELPWIDFSLGWLDFLGLTYERKGYQDFYLPGQESIQGFTYHVPGDLSSLAFPLAAALITRSSLTIKNVDLNDSQGDKCILEILSDMGAKWKIDQSQKELTIEGGVTLKGSAIDINSCIDALPILAVIACFAEGSTVIKNGYIARKKECDRIHAIATELKKMGADITEKEDGLVIQRTDLKGALLNSYRDHRMGLALSVAAMQAKGETVIEEVTCIQKTYPHFKSQFEHVGADIKEES